MAKLTRRSYKRKKVAFAAVILGGVALVSSGFAAWVLSSSENQGNNGSVNVGTVVNGTLDMKVFTADDLVNPIAKDANLPENYLFSFNSDENDKKGSQEGGETHFGKDEKVYWGKQDGEKPERLSNKFVIEITSKSDSLQSFNAKLSIVEDDKKQGFAKAVTAKCFDLPACFSDDGVTVSASGDANNWSDPSLTNDVCKVKKESNVDGKFKWTFEYTVSFKWGDRFNGVNPCYFFDSDNPSKESSNARTGSTDETIGDGYGVTNGHDVTNDVIEADLGWLSEKVNGATYKIEFTATGK